MKHVFPQDLVVENETVAALRRTLAFLEEHGWSHGFSWGDNGQACIGSALSMVGGGMCSSATHAIRDVIGKRSVAAWNDDPSTTWDMVRSAFLEAIETSCRT